MLRVIYLVFNEGYSASSGEVLSRDELCVEAIRLASGGWLIVYNDTEEGRHSLAVSLSDDEGRTWPLTQHLELVEPEQGSFSYPSAA